MKSGKYKIFEEQYTREDIKRLRRSKTTNKTPHAHDTKSALNYWFKCENKKYFLIYYYDRLRLMLGIN